MKGLTFIGMPGAGKSAVGKRIAQRLGMKFIDLDDYILETQGMSHHEIMVQKGEPALIKLEDDLTLGLNLADTIFSPGGSIVYSKKAMEKLKKETIIVYLVVPLEIVKRNSGDKINRNGIIGLAGKGIEGLYNERTPLYDACADIKVDCQETDLREKVEKVYKIIKEKLDEIP